jgi:hypothetical protein
MAETGNTEKLAKIVSQDIFKWFKWSTCSAKDENWECVSEHHLKKQSHPSDVVFYYEDPYTGKTIYQNTDLKSYGKSSITVASVSTALTSLAMAVECANVSSSWQDKFLITGDGFDHVEGLLFIYNHDGDYDAEFSDLTKKIEFDKLRIIEHAPINLIGPKQIERLINIVSDIKFLKAEDTLPSIDDYTFFYPDLVRARRNGNEWGKPATIESLLSPWIIIKHKAGDSFSDGFIIYYNDLGDSVEEFVYLIDAMSHYQMLVSDFSIRIRFTNHKSTAPLNFEKAKLEYLKIWGNDEARKEQLNRINTAQITHFSRQFSTLEVGMQQDV